jgi:hypothetical protein
MSSDVTDIATTDVVFLGAGFSKAATGGDAPVMADFFASLDRRKYWELWSFLDQLTDNPRTANVEHTLFALDQLTTSPLEGVEPFFDEVRSRNQRVRRELDSYILERLGHLKIHEDNWAAQVLHRASEATTVITTNYDNLAERILSCQKGLRHRIRNTNCHHCKLCAILSDECECAGGLSIQDAWRGSLLKLHGSISWRQCMNIECQNQQCLLPDQHCRMFTNQKCDTCGGDCSPALIPPSMMKTFDKFRGLKQVWNAAYQAMADAKSMIFWGFSFPTSDILIRQMLKSSLLNYPRAVEIGIIDLNPEKVAVSLQELIGDVDDEIVIQTYEVPSDGKKPEWLVDGTPPAIADAT